MCALLEAQLVIFISISFYFHYRVTHVDNDLIIVLILLFPSQSREALFVAFGNAQDLGAKQLHGGEHFQTKCRQVPEQSCLPPR